VLLGQTAVRLVGSLRVVEEIDAKKYSSRKDLADRARRLLPRLESQLGSAGAPAAIATGVTIEVPFDAGARHRPVDADQEVLDACDEMRQLAGKAVTLVTFDTAMRLRALARRLATLRLGDEHRRTPTLPGGS
jgi:predicted ribonuclease YlaK